MAVRYWSELGFFGLPSGGRGAGECRLLSGLPSYSETSGAVAGILAWSGALAVSARGMVCKTVQFDVPSLSGTDFSRCWQIFWEPSVTHSCELSRARGCGSRREFTPR